MKLDEIKRERGRKEEESWARHKALLPSPLAMSFVDVCDRWAHTTKIRKRRQKEKASLPVRCVHFCKLLL